MADEVSDGINAHLLAENERLIGELADARDALKRPINVSVAAPGAGAAPSGIPGHQGQHLQGMETKLGYIQTQLGNIATNTSYVASAIQASVDATMQTNKTLVRIAEALEALVKP